MSRITDLLTKTKRLVNQGKGFFSVSGGKYADALLGGLLWLTLAKVLPQAKYGLITYWYSLGLVLSSVSLLGFHTAIKTLLPKGEEKIKLEGNRLSLLPTLVFIVVLALLIPYTMFGILLYIFFRTRYVLSRAEILGERNYQEFLYVAIVKRVIQIGASLGFYYLIGVYGILLGLSSGLAATSYRSFKSLFSFSSFNLSVSKAHSSFVLSTFAMATVGGIIARLDRILIGFLYGNKLLGVYGFISQIASLLLMLPRSFSGYLLPEKAAGRKAKLAEIVGISGSIALTFLAFLLSPWGVHWLFNKFSEGILAIQIISFIPIFTMIAVVLSTTVLSQEKGHTAFLTTVISRSVRIGGILTLYNLFGIVGVGIALLLEEVSSVIVLWISTGFQEGVLPFKNG